MLGSTHWWCSDVEVLTVHQGEVVVHLPLHSVLLKEDLTHQASRLMRGGARGRGMWKGEDEKRGERRRWWDENRSQWGSHKCCVPVT